MTSLVDPVQFAAMITAAILVSTCLVASVTNQAQNSDDAGEPLVETMERRDTREAA